MAAPPPQAFGLRETEPSGTVVNTNELNIGAAIILFVLFTLSALAILIRSVLLMISKKHPLRQTRTRFFLLLVICSAAMRAVFFILLHVKLAVHLYFFLWFVPEFLNIAAFVMLLRSWIRVWATCRHVTTFTYRSVSVRLLLAEVLAIAVIEIAQLAIFVTMIVLGEGDFDFMQRLDSWYMGTLEIILVMAAVFCVVLVKYLERKAKRRHDIIVDGEQTIASLFNRTDAVMLVWVIARLVRAFDCLMSMNSDIDETIASSDLFPLYVGPFYLFAELLPLASLLFGKVIETLDYGTTEYKLLNLLPTLYPAYKSRYTSLNLQVDGAVERDVTRFESSDDEPSEDEIKAAAGNALYDEKGKRLRATDGFTSPLSPENPIKDTFALLKQLSHSPRVKAFIIPFEEIQIIQRIGGGAGGIVMKAVWNDMIVAVKQLNQFLQEGRDLADFLNEIEIMSSLRHQNIVTFYGACIQPPHVCIVSEYLKRDNLRTVLDDNTLRIGAKLLARMIRDICKGMAVIHKAKIIHRDLKPQNLMVDKHYRIKVGDFGVSRMLPGSGGASYSGYFLSIAGSSVYIAPEVYNLKYTHKCDCFSFGLILWEMCTRQYIPLRAEDLLHGKRPEIPSHVPALYAHFIRTCWSANPADRPEFRSMLMLLKQWKGQESSFQLRPEDDRDAHRLSLPSSSLLHAPTSSDSRYSLPLSNSPGSRHILLGGSNERVQRDSSDVVAKEGEMKRSGGKVKQLLRIGSVGIGTEEEMRASEPPTRSMEETDSIVQNRNAEDEGRTTSEYELHGWGAPQD